MDISILEDIGLTKAEIEVYLALLEIGPSTSGPIINKSGLQSSVVHRVLKQLIEKGLITYVKFGKDNQYQTADPKVLVNYIENKKKRLLDILPELESKNRAKKEKNEVEMVFGKRAIFTILNDLIKDAKSNEEYLSFSLIEPHEDKDIITFYQSHNLRRREKKLKVKVLVNEKVRSIYEKNYSKDLLRKANVRYTSFHFPQGIVIFRNVIVFLTWEDKPMAVKITNYLMTEQFREFFLEAYNQEKNAY